jgi:hypothetical protein
MWILIKIFLYRLLNDRINKEKAVLTFLTDTNADGNFYGVTANGAWNFETDECEAETDANNNPIQNWLYDIYSRDCIWKANRVARGLQAFDNTVINQGPINIFFSLMSMAMALSCPGRVYVMTDFPSFMPTVGAYFPLSFAF